MRSLFAVTFVMQCGSASSRWRQLSKDCRTSPLGITFFRKLLSWEIKKKKREVFLQNGLEATEKVPLCHLLLRGFEILARVQCLQCCDLSGDRAVAPPDLRASWGWDVKDSATGVRVPQEPPLSYTLESALTRARTVRFWIISHRRAGGNTCNTNPSPYTPSSVYPLYISFCQVLWQYSAPSSRCYCFLFLIDRRFVHEAVRLYEGVLVNISCEL